MLYLRPLAASRIHLSRRSTILISRPLSSYRPLRAQPVSKNDKPVTKSDTSQTDDSIFYRGPLSGTFHSLKLFSLSSLGLCLSVSPFIYLVDSTMATSARTGLVAFALATSGLSTALVGWLGSPYVIAMRRLDGKTLNSSKEAPPGSIEIFTRNVVLQDRFTRVYDPIFLGSTKRAFAKWQLLDQVVVDTKSDEVDIPERRPGGTEVAAETVDRKGNVKGKWVLRWEKQDGAASDTILVGRASKEGSVVKYFNVHEELL